MENIFPFIPAVVTGGLIVAKLRLGKPLSWPMVLAPLALYALPFLISLIIPFAILGWLLSRLPGGKAVMGTFAALLAAGLVWVRKLFKALKN